MGLFDWVFGKKRASRFLPVSEDDALLLPQQVMSLRGSVLTVTTAILGLQDTSDEMLPEDAFFVPNLLMEFTQNPRLAMIHGDGTAHAWIDMSKLRKAFAIHGPAIVDYRTLFRAFESFDYDIRKIDYIGFRSSLKRLR